MKKGKSKDKWFGFFSPFPMEALEHSQGRGRQPAQRLQPLQQWEWQQIARAAEHPPLPTPCTGTLRCLLPSNDAPKRLRLDLVNLAGRYGPPRQPLYAISCASFPVSAISLKRCISAVHQHYYCRSTFFIFFLLPKCNLGDLSPQENDLNIT